MKKIFIYSFVIISLFISGLSFASGTYFFDLWNWGTDIFRTDKQVGTSVTADEFNEVIYTIKELASGIFIQGNDETTNKTVKLINGLQLGQDSSECNEETEGLIQYDKTDQKIKWCDGANWLNINETKKIYKSCSEIKAFVPSSESGVYSIQPDENADSFDVYCDMETDGGGWTLVAKSTNPSIWEVSNEYALGHYDKWISENDYTYDYRKFLDKLIDGDTAQIRFYDHINPAYMDIIYKFDKNDLLAANIDDELEHQTFISKTHIKTNFDTSNKAHGVSHINLGYQFRILQTDSMATAWCDNRNAKSYIMLIDGDGSSLHTGICSNGLIPFDQNNYYSSWNRNNTGERVSIAFRSTNFSFLPAEKSCLAHKQKSRDISGTYKINPTGNEEFEVYCDMETDGGGWTLIGSYPKSQSGGLPSISYYGDIPELNPNDPTKLWMYKASLLNFTDVREQISCDSNGCLNAYGLNKDESDLNIIRNMWGYAYRKNLDYSLVPDCIANYTNKTENIEYCTRYDLNFVYSSGYLDHSIGWAWDLNQNGHSFSSCWVARGAYNPTAQGSALCSGEPNGTQWALLWMR